MLLSRIKEAFRQKRWWVRSVKKMFRSWCPHKTLMQIDTTQLLYANNKITVIWQFSSQIKQPKQSHCVFHWARLQQEFMLLTSILPPTGVCFLEFVFLFMLQNSCKQPETQTWHKALRAKRFFLRIGMIIYLNRSELNLITSASCELWRVFLLPQTDCLEH